MLQNSQKTKQYYKNKKSVLKGEQNHNDGLYDVKFRKPTTTHNNILTKTHHEKINLLIQVDKNKSELAQFLHGTLFSPAISTLTKAIANNHFLTWPGIKKWNFKKLVANSIPMNLGHLNQERKNLQSTKNKKTNSDNINNCFFLHHEKEKCSIAFSTIHTIVQKQTAYGDLTGQFPYKSLTGNKYIYVMYDYDSNVILEQATQN